MTAIEAKRGGAWAVLLPSEWPKDALESVFAELSEKDLAKVGCVCRRWRAAASSPALTHKYEVAFGVRAWKRHFGDVGEEPALPRDINAILKAPCPFWNGKTVGETHLLTLIPSKVDRKPFSLDLLRELIQKPTQGQATDYSYYADSIKAEDKGRAPGRSYWLLLTHYVLPGSRRKNYQAQREMVDWK